MADETDWERYDSFVETVRGWFEKHDDEYLCFEKIENPRSLRSDLNAFLLLDSLVPGKSNDIISAASHDEIYLGISLEGVQDVLTEEMVVELIRCGVRFEEEGFKMFA